jgi:hypothetical protein
MSNENGPPPELRAAGTVEIPGHGTVHLIAAAPGVGDPRGLLGREILLDGELVRVRGVETFPVADPSGRPVGVMTETAG